MAYLEDADRIGQPFADEFYDSFYDEDRRKFICFDKYIYPGKNISIEQLEDLEEKLDDLAFEGSQIFQDFYSGHEDAWKVNSLLEWDEDTDNVKGYFVCYGVLEESLVEEFDKIVDGFDVEVLDEPKATKKAS